MPEISREHLCIYALTQLKGVSLQLARHLIEFAGSATALWADPQALARLNGHVYTHLYPLLRDRAKLEETQALLQRTADLGIRMVSIYDADYPPLLLQCADAPLILFYLGDLAPLHAEQTLSVVGTRKPSQHGVEDLQTIISHLPSVTDSVTIVSGLALGLDAVAHKAALQAGLPTVAVLAHGLHMIYPSNHRNLARSIVSLGGALLSEYPAGVKPQRHQFVLRNRIVAGLTQATLVGQSAERGGSLITAHQAFDYDRAVYALPGRPSDRENEGCNNLIYNNIAKLITSATHLCEDLEWKKPDHEARSAVGSMSHESKLNALRARLEPETRPLLDLLIESGDGLSIDAICDQTLMGVNEVSFQLFLLESEGAVSLQPDGRYKLQL